MTRNERFIKERQWLKTDHFAVTNSLRDMLAASKLPPKEQERLAYVQNKILITADEEKWALISRRYWQDKCGAHYKGYVDTLKEWGQIEVNPSYWASHDDDAYPKSYRVPLSALREGVSSLNFRRKRFRAPMPDNNPEDDASRYALKCLLDLSVVRDADFWLPEDPIRLSRVEDHCKRIAFKDFRISYGTNCRRLFHRVVMMPAEGRCNLKHYCQPLVEYDVKSCHPLLLVPMFDYEGERKGYQDLIAADIYTEIGKAMGIPDRDRVKTDFLRVVNPGWRDLGWLGQQYVFNFFEERFPHFTKTILSTRTDLAIFLQNYEADLMVQHLGAYCRTEGLFWIPQHDGWISTPDDGEKICLYAKKLISGSVGFVPTLTRKPLSHHDSPYTLKYSSIPLICAS